MVVALAKHLCLVLLHNTINFLEQFASAGALGGDESGLIGSFISLRLGLPAGQTRVSSGGMEREAPPTGWHILTSSHKCESIETPVEPSLRPRVLSSLKQVVARPAEDWSEGA